ncbi:hypothetical protein CHL67_07430 [Prosthecochloris sp. GSB1]|uniref:RimK-like ATPgrasp N-terminal domain-containing protein n=1 Tax=Prosthecochloris sp. GSB1 TaxID=281093 RepID=UPI000B8CF496|nr:RimK-like ATPgrasp N-terminal domain-containing protein [Prosthecochloris sp. GSB1]ASQ90774.1 hypothetical protein CHL67_07430 [Prosthecochloris sp. GSB1]
MSKTIVVVSSMEDWSVYAHSDLVYDFETYLKKFQEADQPVQVINLAGGYGYLGRGYYCSLLAEARGHKVLPSLQTLGGFNQPAEFKEFTAFPFLARGAKWPGSMEQDELEIFVVFGMTAEERFEAYAKSLFHLMDFPLLKARLKKRGERRWLVESVKPLTLDELDDREQDFFALALERYHRRIWYRQRSKKVPGYDLAILHDPDEEFPPSNRRALQQFIVAAKNMDISAELITADDFRRLPEFDALFIRETTAVNHHTYSFSREAQRLGLVVIDDPASILRCTNKVYLHDLLTTHAIRVPETRVLSAGSVSMELLESLVYPLVLKIPDGSFSRGVSRVERPVDAMNALERLFSTSHLVLAQQYIYTDFDWRIGILNHVPLFACRYYMAKGHWQIYAHGAGDSRPGEVETVPVRNVPPGVVKAAQRASALIGNGLYGVDIKEKDGTAYVVEVNDNPSIDYGVEDFISGDELYRSIVGEFLRRLFRQHVFRP